MANDVVDDVTWGKGTETVMPWMRNQPNDHQAWLLLKINDLVDRSGAKKDASKSNSRCPKRAAAPFEPRLHSPLEPLEPWL
eukprot:8395786-Pyramimonas_sp.AAC.1